MIDQRHGDETDFNGEDPREGLPLMVWVIGLMALVAVLLWMFGSYHP